MISENRSAINQSSVSLNETGTCFFAASFCNKAFCNFLAFGIFDFETCFFAV